MTYKQIAEMVESIGLPCEYYQFTADTAVPPPFIVYYYDTYDDVFADDANYQRIVELTIEMYTATKRIDLEAEVEDVLADAGLTYTKDEAYIDDEKLYEQIYTTEVIING